MEHAAQNAFSSLLRCDLIIIDDICEQVVRVVFEQGLSVRGDPSVEVLEELRLSLRFIGAVQAFDRGPDVAIGEADDVADTADLASVSHGCVFCHGGL